VPKVTVGGQIRLRPEYRDNADLSRAKDDRDTLTGERARVGVRVETQRLKAVVEVQDARQWGTEVSPLSNEGNIDLHQANVTIPDLGWSGLALTLGRQELAYGDERLLGALDWATTARSFDGGVARYAWKTGSVDALAALVNDRRTAQRGTGDIVLTGAYGRVLRGRSGGDLDLYVLNLGDRARIAGETPAPVDTTRITTVGARARYGRRVGVQASAEAAFQVGHRGPDRHEAHALDASVGYALDSRWRPQVLFTWDAATADGDPRDGRSREFHNLFPTNHLFYGYADLLGWRNMRAVRGTLRLSPREGHSLSLDVHRFRLAESRGPWKDAAGALLGQDATGAAGRDIGDEIDVAYRLPVRRDLGVLLGYSVFVPGRFAERVRGGDAQTFSYAQVLLKF
jgi:hypothetical protein